MLNERTETVRTPAVLPLPITSIGRRVADLALEDRRNRLNINDLASRAATSVRTVSRLSPLETGFTLKAWRQRVRIVQAKSGLARGDALPALLPSSFCQYSFDIVCVSPGHSHDTVNVSCRGVSDTNAYRRPTSGMAGLSASRNAKTAPERQRRGGRLALKPLLYPRDERLMPELVAGA
jgi:AraC-like DNA-binding protein